MCIVVNDFLSQHYFFKRHQLCYEVYNIAALFFYGRGALIAALWSIWGVCLVSNSCRTDLDLHAERL